MNDSADRSSTNHLRRRNSIATSVVPTRLSLPTVKAKPRHSCSFPVQNGAVSPAPSSPPSLDLELISFKTTTTITTSSEAYTSLKDLIPSSPSGAGINSPTASVANSGYEISIRNRLVKQAAWAYLQPMSSSPSSDGSHFLSRLWFRLSSTTTAAPNPFMACLGFFKRHVVPTLTRAVDLILRALRVRTAR